MQKRLREILIVDNYDSFTHNVAALVSSASQVPCRVVRAKEGAALIEAPWKSVIFGPGPSTPEAHPELLDCIARLPHDTPALGICLGMQAFAHLHGGSLALLDRPRHGKLRTVTEVGSSRFFEWPNCPFPVGSYHSWIVDELPEDWTATARDDEGIFMAMEHECNPWAGVQFHPESVMTPQGLQLMIDFLNPRTND